MASELQRNRRRFGFGLLVAVGVLIFYFVGPGLPVIWAPRASAEMKAAGRALFAHEWKTNDPLAGGDGLGPVFNGKSCVACHFQGGVGGAGPNKHNVLTFQVFPSRRDPQFRTGLIHHFAVAPGLKETPELARKLYPIEPGINQVIDGCTVRTPDFNPLRTEAINTTALFGAGWIERISQRNIQHNRMSRGWEKMMEELSLDFSTVAPGKPRVLPGGRIGKFGWRGQFATLREFVAAACANELGLGNPLMEQAKPLGQPSYPASRPDLDDKQFAALVAFVDTLPRPKQVWPEGPERQTAERGQKLFATVGCVLCHVPDLGGVEGIYSDLLLHELEDKSAGADGYGNPAPPPLPLPDGLPRLTEWKTPPLWGVADSAPYFHDGGSPTLEQAILRHRGDANRVTRAYQALPVADRQAVIAFLKTLRAP